MKKAKVDSYLFIGPQGSGKGTQAKILADYLGYAYFSMGETLKKMRDSNTVLGKKAKKYYDQGILVPERISEQVLITFLKNSSSNKIVFEGYPRTIYQKKILLKTIKKYNINSPIAIYLKINNKTVFERIAKRKLCHKCGKSFWPKDLKYDLNICRVCGGKLQKRPDDTQDALEKRLKIFHERTKPLIDTFKREKKLITIDGTTSIKEVSQSILKKINEYTHD